MFGDIKYLQMKKLLLKNFRNSRVYIESKGSFNTRFCIDKSKVLINKRKIIISNEDIDCIILLDFIKNIKIDDDSRIELISKDSQYILEI